MDMNKQHDGKTKWQCDLVRKPKAGELQGAAIGGRGTYGGGGVDGAANGERENPGGGWRCPYGGVGLPGWWRGGGRAGGLRCRRARSSCRLVAQKRFQEGSAGKQAVCGAHQGARWACAGAGGVWMDGARTQACDADECAAGGRADGRARGWA